MTKRIDVKFSEWMGLTPEQRDRWLDHLRMQNLTLCLIDDKLSESPNEYQLDHESFVEEMSIGGRKYRERR